MATTRFTASFLQPVKASKIQNEKKVNVEGNWVVHFPAEGQSGHILETGCLKSGCHYWYSLIRALASRT